MTEQESEDVAQSADVEEEGGPSCRSCGGSCLGLLILFGLTFGLLSANAGARLDAKVSDVGQEILDLQEAADQRRATILGAPANDQNAVADYNGFMWVLATGRENDLPLAWRENRPLLPTDVEDMIKRVAPDGVGMDSVDTAYLAPVLEPHFDLEALDGRRQKRFQASQKLFKRFRPLLRYVRDGLRRGRCDWQVNWEKGANFNTPNLMQVRGAANLLAYEASLQPPREALQTGFEIVAFGQDAARHGSLIGAMIGIAVSQIGFQSLVRTLERPGLELGDYQRVIDVLATYRAPAIEELLETERVAMTVALLQMSGRSVDQSEAAENSLEGYAYTGPLGALSGWDVFQARELAGYEGFQELGLELARLPRGERRRQAAHLETKLREEHYLIANQLFVNVDACCNELESVVGQARVVRALAAAHQVRLRTGSFPARIQALAGVLGEGLDDPTADAQPALLGYALNPPYVRCWIAGHNGVNDGGPKLQLPRPKWTKPVKGKKRKKKKKRAKKPGVGGGGDDIGFQTMPPPVAPAKGTSAEGR